MDKYVRLVFDEQYFAVCLSMIRAAKENIFLSTFVVNLQAYRKQTKTQSLLGALKEAAQRGVEVKILLNRYQPQRKITKLNNLAALYLKGDNIDLRFLPDNRCCHAKFIVVDKKSFILGSHNWTRKALERNFEVSFFLEDVILAGELTAWFLRLFLRSKKF